MTARYVTPALLFLVFTTLSACTVVCKVDPPATKAQRPLTISDTLQICENIQSDNDIPIGCSVEYYEGKPMMNVLFSDVGSMNSLWEAMVQNVTLPFCNAATSSNREAFLIILVNNIKKKRFYSCEKQKWADWFDYTNKGRTY
jgi:hypothetical protein